MKRKDVLLDFTPLLDVTLILLFFFLLFSTFEVGQAKAELEDRQAELQAQQIQAEQLYAQAQAMAQQLEGDLDILGDADRRQRSNVEALMEFNRGANIKLLLSMEGGTGILRILLGQELIVSVPSDSDLSGTICALLEDRGYTREDTILCEFILDGSEPGTAAAYRRIRENLLYVKGEYHYFYYSETDLSTGGS